MQRKRKEEEGTNLVAVIDLEDSIHFVAINETKAEELEE